MLMSASRFDRLKLRGVATKVDLKVRAALGELADVGSEEGRAEPVGGADPIRLPRFAHPRPLCLPGCR